MCNEDDNSSEIFLTFAPLKANDQDMSLRSSDQNIMKIPTDGFQEFNIIFAYFTFPSYLFIAQKRQRHFCIHNTIQYTERDGNNQCGLRKGGNNSKLSGPSLSRMPRLTKFYIYLEGMECEFVYIMQKL